MKDQLRAKYRDAAVVRGGDELYLRHDDALRLIDDSERADVIILGIDFFVEYDDGGIAPTTSADWSFMIKEQDACEPTAAIERRLHATG